MIRLTLILGALVLTFPSTLLAQKVLVFVDGSQMEIQSYEVKGQLVQFRTADGKLQSVPRSYVNLVATEQRSRGTSSPSASSTRPTSSGTESNRSASPAPPRPSSPAPPPPSSPAPSSPPPDSGPAPMSPPPPDSGPEPMPTTPITPEPDMPPPQPPRPAPAMPPPMGPAASPNMPMDPPPVWVNDELQVSLVVPSAAWRLEEMPASFDVAVSLDNPTTEARATLALIRQHMRNNGDFRRVVEEVEMSVAGAPGYRPLANGALMLEPYTAHEFRFLKDVGFVTVYNRLVIVYSRDLAYVLSLTCPEARVDENASDFEALVRGLVIKKTRNDLTP